MTARDWADAPYVRVYATLGRDHPNVYRDLRLLGGYVRLLMAADGAWPGPAEVPVSIPVDVLAALEADEVIDVEAGFYRFHGLEAERNGRVRGAAVGGRARASLAQRDSSGRFLPADDDGLDEPLDDPLDQPSSSAGEPAGRNGSTDRLDAPAGQPAGVPADQRAKPRRAEPTRLGSSSPPAPARPGAPAREAPDPTAIRCRDYHAHRSEHRWWGSGVGWRCPVCDAQDVEADNDAGRSFTEKVRIAAGRDESPF